MKKIIFVLTLCFIFLSTQVHAARFGGGKSFGHRSSQTSQNSHNSNQSGRSQQTQPPHQQPQPNQMPPKSSFASKILPALAGLSIGALLGSMLGGHGLGGGLSTIFIALMVAGLVFYIVKKFLANKNKNTDYNHHQYQNTATQTNFGNTYAGLSGNQNFYQESYKTSPLNKEEFLRTAKTTFIRMQNAYDNKNLADIKDFTTPEVYAEIQMQIQERGSMTNQTDVIYINASLIDSQDADHLSANVLFSGQIKEQPNTQPVEIDEIWHFIKHDNNKWLIAGIEQKN